MASSGAARLTVSGKSAVLLPLKAVFILLILLPSLVASMMDWFDILSPGRVPLIRREQLL